MATPYVTLTEERVRSTQDFAGRAFATADDGVPVLVVAEEQEAGRGRRDNPWWNCPRPMLASLAMQSPPLEHVTLVPLMAGMAARRAIESQLGVSPSLKWPNDIMVGDAKVGGVLSERSEDTITVGCGLNLWWPDPVDGAAGLLDHDPGPHAAMDIARQWAEAMLEAVPGLPASFDHTAYVEVCDTIGRRITWQPEGAGKALGISSDGALVVATASGEVTVRSGEVSHIRAATIASDPSD